MLRCIVVLLSGLCVASLPGTTVAEEPAQRPAPVGIIFDTDMGNDIDDALALGLLHALEQRGQCRLLAVTVTKDHALAAPFVDVINTFYGRGDVPLGAVRDGVTPEDSSYLPLANVRDGEAERYPHALKDGKTAEDAIKLLRRTLAAQPDRSVVIVQVGFSTNLARLLKSTADDISPLSGHALITAKVRELSVMAGAFAPIPGTKRYGEYNIIKDLAAAQFLAQEWPTPIVWSGYEIGIALPYPETSIQRDFAYVNHHPCVEGYRLYLPKGGDRPTWDLTSALYAVWPDRGYFDLSPPGDVMVESDAVTRFTPNPAGRHRYMILKPEQKQRTLETLVLLASQPPHSPAPRPMP